METHKYAYLKNILSLAVLAVAGLTSAARAGENDQLWLTGALKGNISDKASVKVTGQHRYKEAGHYYYHTEPGVGYKYNRNLSVAAAFRLISAKNKTGDWKHIYGYILDPTYAAEGLGAQMKFRFRFAYYDPRADIDSTTDFRPKFILSPAQGITDWKIKPYLADELMYNFDLGKLYRNRLSAGLTFKPLSKVSLGAFLMYEVIEKNDDWQENWNYGISAALSL